MPKDIRDLEELAYAELDTVMGTAFDRSSAVLKKAESFFVGGTPLNYVGKRSEILNANSGIIAVFLFEGKMDSILPFSSPKDVYVVGTFGISGRSTVMVPKEYAKYGDVEALYDRICLLASDFSSRMLGKIELFKDALGDDFVSYRPSMHLVLPKSLDEIDWLDEALFRNEYSNLAECVSSVTYEDYSTFQYRATETVVKESDFDESKLKRTINQ